MNNTIELYVVFFGSKTNHSYPMRLKDAFTLLNNNIDLPGPRWWIGRWEA